jgi:hypothetical protein
MRDPVAKFSPSRALKKLKKPPPPAKRLVYIPPRAPEMWHELCSHFADLPATR